MTHPATHGFSTFPFDVDLFSDEKIVAIAGEFGLKGEMIVVKLLCAIYRNGYFIEWTDKTKYQLLNSLQGVTAGLLDNVIQRLVRWGFFDKDLFDSAHILTNVVIQRRYRSACSRSHRRDVLTVYSLLAPPPTKEIAEPTPVAAQPPSGHKPSTQEPQPAAAPASAPQSPVPLHHSIPILRADRAWQQALAKTSGLTIDAFPALLDDFELHVRSLGQTEHPDLFAARRHFAAWLKKRIATASPPPAASQSAKETEASTEEKEDQGQIAQRRYLSRVPEPDRELLSYTQYCLLGYGSVSDSALARDLAEIRAGRKQLPSRISDIIAYKNQTPSAP